MADIKRKKQNMEAAEEQMQDNTAAISQKDQMARRQSAPQPDPISSTLSLL